MGVEPPNGSGWRVQDHERRIQNLERSTEGLSVLEERMKNLGNRFTELAEEVRADTRGLRRAIIGAAITVTVGFVGLAAALVLSALHG